MLDTARTEFEPSRTYNVTLLIPTQSGTPAARLDLHEEWPNEILSAATKMAKEMETYVKSNGSKYGHSFVKLSESKGRKSKLAEEKESLNRVCREYHGEDLIVGEDQKPRKDPSTVHWTVEEDTTVGKEDFNEEEE